MSKFGELIKNRRIALGYTLREFCSKNSLDPGNVSKFERGVFPPPQDPEVIERYAKSLEFKPGSEEWVNFFDTAAAEAGLLPQDIASDKEIIDRLPVFFRTIRDQKISPEKLDELIEKIKRA